MDRYNGSSDSWRIKGARFVRYLKSRPTECWGFFAAGALIGMIFL
ncbi:hypothetical protein [Litorimonas sp. WD9-15]